jgi:hypothetical protein
VTADAWTLIFLGLVLKVPVVVVLVALWKVANWEDEARRPPPPAEPRMALCAYCGTAITLGYDANAIHAEAERLARTSGEATFDVETRLVRASLALPGHYAAPPRRCPECGEAAVWTPIAPLAGLDRETALVGLG